MVVLKVLAPDLPVFKLLFKADDKRKLAVICLCSSLDPLPFFFFEFAAIFCDFFVNGRVGFLRGRLRKTITGLRKSAGYQKTYAGPPTTCRHAIH